MLPFLDKKKLVGFIASHKRPGQELASEKSDMSEDHKAIGADLLAAIEAKSPHDLMEALKEALHALSQPEEAGPDQG